MSGTFNEIDVPPTLVSFAVDIAKEQDIVTPELKKAGSKLVLLKVDKDAYDLPVYSQVMDLYGKFHEDIQAGRVLSAYALDGKGLVAALCKDGIRKRTWMLRSSITWMREISLLLVLEIS